MHDTELCAHLIHAITPAAITRLSSRTITLFLFPELSFSSARRLAVGSAAHLSILGSLDLEAEKRELLENDVQVNFVLRVCEKYLGKLPDYRGSVGKLCSGR
jgi:hypothetical protein